MHPKPVAYAWPKISPCGLHRNYSTVCMLPNSELSAPRIHEGHYRLIPVLGYLLDQNRVGDWVR